MGRFATALAITGILALSAPRATRAAPTATTVQQVPPDAAEPILGRSVIDADDKSIGRLIDVLVDASGQPEAAVIDFGGFMGVGNRKVVVHWSVLRFHPGDPKHAILLEMTPDQIKDAPEYLRGDKPAPVVTPAPNPAAEPQGAPSGK
jgi:hypothetical protein